ncbi:MAG: RpoL/Rpb11 RNA polymerase subunit family protein [Thermoproteota archaeon]
MRTVYRSKGKGEAELEVYGETHTLLNLLTSYLNKKLAKGYSAYRIEHPLKQEATLYIYAGEKKPRDVLVKSLRELIEELEDFEEKLKEAAEGRASAP